MKTSGRVMSWIGAAVLMSVVIVCGCGSKGGSNTTGPSSQNTLLVNWPSDVIGMYSVKVELEQCGLLSCTWDSLDTFEQPVCDFPFGSETDTAAGFVVNSIEGEVSGSVVNVSVDATIELQDGSQCRMTMTISADETEKPPMRDSWQVITKTRFPDCPELVGMRLRYTFTRTGDYNCKGQAGKISAARWLIPVVIGT